MPPSPPGAGHIPGRRCSRDPSWRPFCPFKSRLSKFPEPVCVGLTLTHLLEYQSLLKQIPPGNESPALPQFSPAVFWWGFMFVWFLLLLLFLFLPKSSSIRNKSSAQILGKMRQEDCKCKAGHDYRGNSRTLWTI